MRKLVTTIAVSLLFLVGISAPSTAAERFNEVTYSGYCSTHDIYSSISGYKSSDSAAKIDLSSLKIGGVAALSSTCAKRVSKICLTVTMSMSGSSAIATTAPFGLPDQYFGGFTRLAGFAATFSGTKKCKSFAAARSASFALKADDGFVYFYAGGRVKIKSAVIAVRTDVTFTDGTSKGFASTAIIKK